jgi:hypothetical protein
MAVVARSCDYVAETDLNLNGHFLRYSILRYIFFKKVLNMCASFAAEIYLWISINFAWCLLDAS